MEKIFFDSSALIAIFNERDDNHKIAVDFFHQLIENGVYLFTTDLEEEHKGSALDKVHMLVNRVLSQV